MKAGEERAPAPSGVVTFVFTDIEGSTRRWEADADAMRTTRARNALTIARRPAAVRDEGPHRGRCQRHRGGRATECRRKDR